MAKYTDPNTGVKYSTHTGLKAFTVIIVILLVVSIVFNVVLFMQNSDESELNSNENEKSVAEDDGDGEEDEGGSDFSNGSSSSSESSSESDSGVFEDDELSGDASSGSSGSQSAQDENMASTSGGSEIVEEPAQVENKKVTNVSEADVNGVSECTFFYDDCSICTDICEGHDMYLTLGGGVYEFYPYSLTIGTVDTTASKEKIQMSLIFEEEPDKKENFVNMSPALYEIGSLTENALDIESIAMSQDLTYTVSNGAAIGEEYIADYALAETDASTDTVKIFETERDFETFGHFTLSVSASGSSYTYEINFIDDSDLWDELMTDYERRLEESREKAEQKRQDNLHGVDSEGDRFETIETYGDGVALGTYYYDDCSICGSWVECTGHAMYRSSSGGFYDFYPTLIPLVITGEEGAPDLNETMQVSLVFDGEPERGDDWFSEYPAQIEVASLTGDALDFEDIYLRAFDEYDYQEYNDTVAIYSGSDVGSGRGLTRMDTSTAATKTFMHSWNSHERDGAYTLFISANGGLVYGCDFYVITDSRILAALEEGRYTVYG